MVKTWAEVVVAGGVVPALFVVGLVAAGVCAGQVWPGARTAAYGGFWFGVLGFVALVLGLQPFTLGSLPDRPPWVPPLAGIVGLFIGAWTTWFYLWLRRSHAVALPLAWQSFGALGLLYLHLTWPAAEEYTVWLAVGIAASSSVFYALGRDLRPRSKPGRRRARSENLADPSRVAERWYQPRRWRRRRRPRPVPPSPRRLGARRRHLPPPVLTRRRPVRADRPGPMS